MATLTTEKGELKTRLDSSIDENKSGNYGAALGLEVGVGLAADWATPVLAGIPVVGTGLYYGVNYAVGAGTNILAQKIRGEDETNWGEVAAAGGFQTIPFGTTAKGWKGVRRAMGKGAAIGVGGEQVRVGIDEQRLLTPEEIAISGTIGAGLGGTIKLGTESADILIKQRRDNILKRKGRPSYTRPGSENIPNPQNIPPDPWIMKDENLTWYGTSKPGSYHEFMRKWGTNWEKTAEAAGVKRTAPNHFKKIDLENRLRRKVDNPDQLELFPTWPGKLTPAELKDEARILKQALLPEKPVEVRRRFTPDGKWIEDLPGVPVSKQRKGGYYFLGKFTEAANEWIEWGKQTGQLRAVNTNIRMGAKVEHRVPKGSYLDKFWQLSNELRPWRPGSRHGPNNVRLLLDKTFDGFKNTVDDIMFDGGKGPAIQDKNVLKWKLTDIEAPIDHNATSLVFQNLPGDLLIRTVDGTIVGRLGHYHQLLYAPREQLLKVLTTKINPKTGKPWVRLTKSNGQPYAESGIDKQIEAWRSSILRPKVNKILKKADEIADMDPFDAKQKIDDAVRADELEFLDEYGELSVAAEMFMEDAGDVQTLINRGWWKGIFQRNDGPIPSKTKTIQGTIKGSSGLPGGG